VLLDQAHINPIAVETRAGTLIKVSQTPKPEPCFILGDLSAHALFPMAEPRTEKISGFYNCHGLVFAARRAAIDETKQIPWILKEDGYEVVTLDELQPGDIAVYYDERSNEATHSAMVIETPKMNLMRVTRVVSKWGNGREYVHRINECTYAANARIEYRRIYT
jgi:hypothetical protein